MLKPHNETSPIILTGLNQPWESVLHRIGTPVRFRPRQMIFQDMREGNDIGCYYVQRGRIRLSHIAPDGKERILLYIGSGTFFYDLPMLTPGYGIFVCMEPTQAFFLRKKLLGPKFVADNPELILNWLEAIAIKCTLFFEHRCNSTLNDIFTNVCRLLHTMAQHQRVNGKIVPRLSQRECAELLGIHRGSLHKALKRLREEGIVGDYKPNALELYDPQRLSKYAFAYS